MEIIPQRYHIGLVFNTFFYPLTSPEILDSLKEHNFDVARTPEPFRTGPRIYTSGRLASKRNCFISLISDRNLVIVDGLVLESVLHTFADLLDCLISDFQIDRSKDISFVEFIADWIIKSKKDPITSIQKVFDKCNFFKGASEIFDEKIGGYKISFSQIGWTPKSRE